MCKIFLCHALHKRKQLTFGIEEGKKVTAWQRDRKRVFQTLGTQNGYLKSAGPKVGISKARDPKRVCQTRGIQTGISKERDPKRVCQTRGTQNGYFKREEPKAGMSNARDPKRLFQKIGTQSGYVKREGPKTGISKTIFVVFC